MSDALAMLARVLEPEVMDTEEEAADYDAMDHAVVNDAFCTDFLAAVGRETFRGRVLDNLQLLVGPGKPGGAVRWKVGEVSQVSQFPVGSM